MSELTRWELLRLSAMLAQMLRFRRILPAYWRRVTLLLWPFYLLATSGSRGESVLLEVFFIEDDSYRVNNWGIYSWGGFNLIWNIVILTEVLHHLLSIYEQTCTKPISFLSLFFLSSSFSFVVFRTFPWFGSFFSSFFLFFSCPLGRSAFSTRKVVAGTHLAAEFSIPCWLLSPFKDSTWSEY